MAILLLTRFYLSQMSHLKITLDITNLFRRQEWVTKSIAAVPGNLQLFSIFQTDQIIAGVQNCLCNSSSSSSIMRVSCFYSDHLSECNCSSNCCWSISHSHHDHDEDKSQQDVDYDAIRNELSSSLCVVFLSVSPTDPYLYVLMLPIMMIIIMWRW